MIDQITSRMQFLEQKLGDNKGKSQEILWVGISSVGTSSVSSPCSLKILSDIFDVNELSLKKQTKHLHIYVQTDVPLVFTT